MVLKVSWRGDELKEFNTVESDRMEHASLSFWLQAGALRTRAFWASGARETRREKKLMDTCHPLIGCPDFYYLIYI
jgi:hypothetical protein